MEGFASLTRSRLDWDDVGNPSGHSRCMVIIDKESCTVLTGACTSAWRAPANLVQSLYLILVVVYVSFSSVSRFASTYILAMLPIYPHKDAVKAIYMP